MPQRIAHAAAVSHRSRELSRAAARPVPPGSSCHSQGRDRRSPPRRRGAAGDPRRSSILAVHGHSAREQEIPARLPPSRRDSTASGAGPGGSFLRGSRSRSTLGMVAGGAAARSRARSAASTPVRRHGRRHVGVSRGSEQAASPAASQAPISAARHPVVAVAGRADVGSGPPPRPPAAAGGAPAAAQLGDYVFHCDRNVQLFRHGDGARFGAPRRGRRHMRPRHLRRARNARGRAVRRRSRVASASSATARATTSCSARTDRATITSSCTCGAARSW